MSDTIFKYKVWLLGGFILFTIGKGLNTNAQDSCRCIKLILGGGYGHYFNTFTNVLDEDVKVNRPSFSVRLVWQPEHKLRLGIESGLTYMYSTTRIQVDGNAEKLTANLKVIPIFLSLSMAVIKRFELNFGTGWTSMVYTIRINKSDKNKVTGSSFSMSNFSAGCSYYIPLSKKIDLGTEVKYLYIGKTDDYHVSGLITFSYKLKSWKVH
jgi:hypothetical protein